MWKPSEILWYAPLFFWTDSTAASCRTCLFADCTVAGVSTRVSFLRPCRPPWNLKKKVLIKAFWTNFKVNRNTYNSTDCQYNYSLLGLGSPFLCTATATCVYRLYTYFRIDIFRLHLPDRQASSLHLSLCHMHTCHRGHARMPSTNKLAG